MTNRSEVVACVNALIRLRHGVAEYPRMLWLLAVGSFLDTAGLSFLWPLNSIYIHEVLGRPLTVAGVVLLLHSGAGTLGQLAGGWLYDRIGARPVLLTGLFSGALIIALPAFFDSWPLYVAVMTLFGFAASLSVPAMNALAAKAWPSGGRRAFNFLYVANNLGVALGTAVGGIVAQHSFSLAFLSAGLMILVFAFFALVMIHDRPEGGAERFPAGEEETGQAEPQVASAAEAPVPWLPINALFVAMLVLWLVYVQWQGPVAVHMQDLGFELSAYSVLWTLNGLLIFAAQPLVALTVRLVRSLYAQMLLGTVLLGGAYGLMLWSDRYSAFVGSMVILTLGEVFLWPVIPAAVAQLSPPSRRGFLQGFIGSAANVGRMVGPVVGGLLYDHLPYHQLVVIMIGGLVVPLVSVGLYAATERQMPGSLPGADALR